MAAAKNMSPKGFLHKTTTKAAGSAAAFLLTHREWLLNGECAVVVSPILAKVDSQELMPTPALQEIKAAVFSHMMILEQSKAEASLEKSAKEKEPKAHVAMCYDKFGIIMTRITDQGKEEELRKDFDLPQDAMRWIDRRLFDGPPGCYATLDHVKTVQQETITRDDSFARVLKENKGAVCKPQSKSTPRLGFGVKAHNDVSKFSRG